MALLVRAWTILKQFFLFLRDLINSRHIIIDLTKNDFKSRYLGSSLGLVWAFVQPSMTILILWFVFQVGFKSAPVANFPFILWIMAGMIPWFFLSESISSATMSIIEKSYLVKKVVFRVSILPIIKILSALVIHLFFLVVMLIMFAGYGYFPHLQSLQIFYYLFAAIVLILGVTWITSSLVVFLNDVGQMIGIVLQFGFWLTPIFWSVKMIPEKYRPWIELNPAYYIIEGYRNSLINNIWFWNEAGLTLYFWSLTIIIFVTGAMLFRRLKPHFADVL